MRRERHVDASIRSDPSGACSMIKAKISGKLVWSMVRVMVNRSREVGGRDR